MNKDKTFRVIAIVALVFGVAGLTLAYAATLTSQLDINGTVTATGTSGKFDVKFITEGASCTAGGAQCATFTVGDYATTLAATLDEGQTLSVTVPIKNNGTVAATRESYTDDLCSKVLATQTYTYGDDTNKSTLEDIGFTCNVTDAPATIAANETANWELSIAYPNYSGDTGATKTDNKPAGDVSIAVAYQAIYNGTV